MVRIAKHEQMYLQPLTEQQISHGEASKIFQV